MNKVSDELLINISLKNIEIINANISKLSSYVWIIKGWVITAWGALYAVSISGGKKAVIFYFIVILGFLISEMVRMLEKKTIELLIKHERALSMAMIGDIKELNIAGFSTNISSVSLDEVLFLINSEKFSLSRAFYIVALIGTFIFCTWFF